MDEIPRRRVTGFIVIALALVVGTLLFGYLMSGCQAAPDPSPQSSGAVSPVPSALAMPTRAVSPSPVTPSPSAIPSPLPSLLPSPSAAPAPTFVSATVPPPPGEPGPTIQVPPPIR